MAVISLAVDFVPCSPEPVNGYNVQYRVAGSGSPFIDAGNFSSSPAVIEVNYPDGTDIEGFIRGDCGDGNFGPNVDFVATSEDGGGGTIVARTLTLNSCAGIFGDYTLSGCTDGDVVVVRMSFSGLIAKTSGLFTRANLDVICADAAGGGGSNVSACYTDTSSHFFNLTVDITITVVGTTAAITSNAVVHNSLDSSTSASLQVISVNGSPGSGFCAGCKGTSSTGGTC